MPRTQAPRPAAIPWPQLGPGQAGRLRARREERGWSLRDLAAASGVSMWTIAQIENGKKEETSANILAALADALADALKVPRGWLAYGG